MFQEKKVVTCFLRSNGEILILHRSEQVGTYKGKWAGISGYVETNIDEQALVEIKEETGLMVEDIQLIKKGKPLVVEDNKLNIRWIVHPFLFQIKDRKKIMIDWEHREAKWISPNDIDSFQTVPCLKETIRHVI